MVKTDALTRGKDWLVGWLVILVMLVMVRNIAPTVIEKNDNDLLKYIQEIGDKK